LLENILIAAISFAQKENMLIVVAVYRFAFAFVSLTACFFIDVKYPNITRYAGVVFT
jgi:hypothetical protein